MNGRADESASDKDEVTGIKHEADTALARSGQISPGKGMHSLGPSGTLREAHGPLHYCLLESRVREHGAEITQKWRPEGSNPGLLAESVLSPCTHLL